MQGEFRGDFTRDTFDPRKHFLRVLMQQGRVQLDADWNEQVAILLHYLQTLAADLIGEHGGPVRRSGFRIEPIKGESSNIVDFTISHGHYYVNGILCENDSPDDKGSISYYNQIDYPLNQKKHKLPEFPFLVYLDVWERHITYIEDETDFIPGIREVALGGPDTATRSRLVWQVKAERFAKDGLTIKTCNDVISNWSKLVQTWQPCNRGLLRAMARGEENQTDPCIIHPNSRYRRPENQLYRVEIHQGGQIDAEPTFKWSRENGAVVFPIAPDSLPVSGKTATITIRLKSLWRDERFGLAVGDWVEIVDDDYVLHQRSEPLWKVDKIDPLNLQITLTREQDSDLAVGRDANKRPLLRRWDQKARSGLTLGVEGTIKVAEVDKDSDSWIALEDGVQIQFQKASDEDKPIIYRTGDYWLIPARTAIGDVEWVKSNGKPVALPPHGIHHHYAPLAVIANDDGFTVSDCRRQFYSLARTNGYVGSAEGIGSDLIFPDD